MDTERTQAPRRSRRPWAMAAVAAAVILAGGGGAYWATMSADGGTRATSPGKNGSPEPLDLAGGVSLVSGKLVVKGKLPDGPGSAAVRVPGSVPRAAVEKLAKALGVPGTVKSDQGIWKAGGGSGPTLQVNQQAPGSWAYSRYGSTPPSTGNSGTGTVPAQTAREKAAPVLAALGLGGEKSDASTLAGNTRTVNVDPVVGGLPTHGWRTTVRVGPDGGIVSGNGMLSPLTKGGSYPVVSAAQAVKEANASSAGVRAPACPSVVPTGSRAPGDDPTLPRALPCLAAKKTVSVLSARFGLSAQFVDGTQALVPSWLFEVAQDALPTPSTVAQQAVDPRYVKPAPTPTATPTATPAPDPSGSGPGAGSHKMDITSYSADGTSLKVRFWGSVCSDYAAAADESGAQVLVRVTGAAKHPGKVCVMLAKEFTETVQLDTPLGARKVIDASDGSTVPKA